MSMRDGRYHYEATGAICTALLIIVGFLLWTEHRGRPPPPIARSPSLDDRPGGHRLRPHGSAGHQRSRHVTARAMLLLS
jgi:hypothetical protein